MNNMKKAKGLLKLVKEGFEFTVMEK
jgi:hypothetical protein